MCVFGVTTCVASLLPPSHPAFVWDPVVGKTLYSNLMKNICCQLFRCQNPLKSDISLFNGVTAAGLNEVCAGMTVGALVSKHGSGEFRNPIF